MVTIAELEIADEPERWSALGFAVEDDRCRIGAVDLRFAGRQAGRGLVRWHLRELLAHDGDPGAEPDLDGLPTARAAASEPPSPAPAHPNGITAIDHVVAISPDLDRTTATLQRVGLDLRRIREQPTPAGAPRQAFFRLGAEILEVVQEPQEIAARAGGEAAPPSSGGSRCAAATSTRPSRRWATTSARSATRSSPAAGSPRCGALQALRCPWR